MIKKKIALVTGGNSHEAEISLKSAKVVEKFIDKNLYEVYVIHIKGTTWNYKTSDNQIFPVDKNDFSITVKGEKTRFDLVFMAIHGTPGEDGRLQAYYDMLNIPYTSSNMLTSAITFNKAICKAVAKEFGANIAKSVVLRKNETPQIDFLLKELELPVFVKPNNGGSSIGMSKVNKTEELESAIAKAFKEDDEVLVESFIAGREITCGVLGFDNDIKVLPLTEIVSQNEFFDFEAKYKGKSKEITPAPISDWHAEIIGKMSKQLFRALGCTGIARFDYILKDSTPYFLEVNTIPGMTEESIVPQQARAMGISEKELYNGLIASALNKAKK